jgi:hypothetical protein
MASKRNTLASNRQRFRLSLGVASAAPRTFQTTTNDAKRLGKLDAVGSTPKGHPPILRASPSAPETYKKLDVMYNPRSSGFIEEERALLIFHFFPSAQKNMSVAR